MKVVKPNVNGLVRNLAEILWGGWNGPIDKVSLYVHREISSPLYRELYEVCNISANDIKKKFRTK